MPVLWGAFHSTRLVTISVRGVAGRQDIDDCADGIMTPATLSYRKLLDLRQGSLALSPQDIAAIAQRVQEHGRAGAMGPLAIIVLPGEHDQHALLFAALSAAAHRPVKVFCDHQAGRDWLDTVPPSAGPAGDTPRRPQAPLAA